MAVVCSLRAKFVGFAVGDLHGDMEKTVKSLQLARVLSLDRRGRATWVGGDTVLVQLGDVLDRGNAEIGEQPSLTDYHDSALPATAHHLCACHSTSTMITCDKTGGMMHVPLTSWLV